jgi:hypothetical protein
VKLVIVPVFLQANLSTFTSAIFNEVIQDENITIVIDGFWNQVSSFIHSLALPYGIPIITFSTPRIFHKLGEEALFDALRGISMAPPRLLMVTEKTSHDPEYLLGNCTRPFRSTWYS